MNPDFSLDLSYGFPVIGIDEAGCGPWAGPVVAAAVIFLREDLTMPWLKCIRDSKQLTVQRRQALFHQMRESTIVYFGVGQASVVEIDTIGIGKANLLAMERAVLGLPILPQVALVDGLRKPQLPCTTHMIVKGDQKSLSIAAASIIAKVTRDQIMQELAQLYPCYGWQTNAGYGTKAHKLAIKHHGVTLHHRRSFAPIAKVLALECELTAKEL